MHNPSGDIDIARIEDIEIWEPLVAKKVKRRIDNVAVDEHFAYYLGPHAVWVKRVGIVIYGSCGEAAFNPPSETSGHNPLAKRIWKIEPYSKRGTVKGQKTPQVRKTKVRIVGDPDLAGQVAQVVKDHFELSGSQRYSAMPTRYGTGHSDSPGCSVYLDIKKPKVLPDQEVGFKQAQIHTLISIVERVRESKRILCELDISDEYIEELLEVLDKEEGVLREVAS
jgi:hypothetical protein